MSDGDRGNYGSSFGSSSAPLLLSAIIICRPAFAVYASATMMALKLTGYRLFVFIACASLPTFFLLSGIQISLPDHFSFSSFIPLPSAVPSALPTPTPQLSLNITNNNATYPRLSLNQPHSQYAPQAKLILDRLQSRRNLLFGGAVKDLNNDMMDRLIALLLRAESDYDYVPPRVVLTSWHWVPCAMGDCTTGEVQWIRPLIEMMRQHNIIYFFSPWENFHQDWKLLGDDLVTHVWADDEHAIWCFADPDKCLKTDKNPTGIPPWKLFAFTFWGSKPYDMKYHSNTEPYSFNPLGSEWNIVPYQMPERQFFLGYHFQGCQASIYVPYEERKNEIVVLAKLSNYYYRSNYDYKTFYALLRNHTNFDIISNAQEEEGYPIPEGLHSVGYMPQQEYDLFLASAKAILGIGQPMISPTPYASLCRGVPVILPYNSKFVLKNNKTCGPRPGPDEWCGFLEMTHQHGPACRIGPPYVYAVDVNSPIEEIFKVINEAISTPIQPYEPPEMKRDAVEKRLLEYFSIDWERFATERIKERGSDKLVLPDFLQNWAKSQVDISQNA